MQSYEQREKRSLSACIAREKIVQYRLAILYFTTIPKNEWLNIQTSIPRFLNSLVLLNFNSATTVEAMGIRLPLQYMLVHIDQTLR